MSLTIEYKTNPSQTEWSTMTIDFDCFSSIWDRDSIYSEIMEYVFTNVDDDDYEENCSVKDMDKYIQIVQSHFNDDDPMDEDLMFERYF